MHVNRAFNQPQPTDITPMEKTAEQRHRELVAATILAGMLANPNVIAQEAHLSEKGGNLAFQAEQLTQWICGIQKQD